MRYDTPDIMTEQERSAEYARLTALIPNEPAGERIRFVMKACIAKEQTVRIWNCSRPIPQAKLRLLGAAVSENGWM